MNISPVYFTGVHKGIKPVQGMQKSIDKNELYKDTLRSEAAELKTLFSEKLETASKCGRNFEGTGISWMNIDCQKGHTHIGLDHEIDENGTEIHRSGVFLDDKILESRVYKEKNKTFLGFETYKYDDDGNLKKYEAEVHDGYFRNEPIDCRKTNKIKVLF